MTAFATGPKNARILAVAPHGDMYPSRRDRGDVLLLRDANGDGKADGAPATVARRAGSRKPANDGAWTTASIFSATRSN